jgi:hypothetical protein
VAGVLRSPLTCKSSKDAVMTFCDCSGLSVLLPAADRRNRWGWRLSVTHPAPSLRRLIGLVGAAGPVRIAGAPARDADPGDAAWPRQTKAGVPGD